MTTQAAQSAASSSVVPISLMGVPGSPYTRKMLAVLRYRHIPYRLILGSHTQTAPNGRPEPKVRMLPTFYLPDADGVLQAVTDSTPLIRRFETDYTGRHAVPGDPVLALIDALIEDYADEWLTKAMFHYRWAYEADISKAGSVLPVWAREPQDDTTLAANNRMISDRQIGRLRYVGSSSPSNRGWAGSSSQPSLSARKPAGNRRLRDLWPAHAARPLRPDTDGGDGGASTPGLWMDWPGR